MNRHALVTIVAVLSLAAAGTSTGIALNARADVQALNQRVLNQQQQTAGLKATLESRLAHVERMNSELIRMTSRTIDQQVRDQKRLLEVQKP